MNLLHSFVWGDFMHLLKQLTYYFLFIIVAIAFFVHFEEINMCVDDIIQDFKVRTSTLSKKLQEVEFDKNDFLGIDSIKDLDIIKEFVDNNSSKKEVDSEESYSTTDNNTINFEEENLYYPYYAMLDKKYHSLYQQIYENAMNLQESFTPVIAVNKDNITSIIEAVMYDHPELFWVENEYSFKYDLTGTCITIYLKFNETAYNNFPEKKRLFENMAGEIIQQAKKYSTDLKKEKYVHDTLLNLLHYELNSPLNQSAYSAIVNHSSVCAGYSKAFQYILMQLNIPCYYVTGYSSGDHAWNIVYIDGKYYNVDLTWDNTGYNSYAYFNKSDSEFSSTHTRNGLSMYLPSCNSSENSNNYVNDTYTNPQKRNDQIYVEVEDNPISNFKEFVIEMFSN